jgi:hypothetical protein
VPTNRIVDGADTVLELCTVLGENLALVLNANQPIAGHEQVFQVSRHHENVQPQLFLGLVQNQIVSERN